MFPLSCPLSQKTEIKEKSPTGGPAPSSLSYINHSLLISSSLYLFYSSHSSICGVLLTFSLRRHTDVKHSFISLSFSPIRAYAHSLFRSLFFTHAFTHTHTHMSFSLSRLAGSFDVVPGSVVTRRSSRREHIRVFSMKINACNFKKYRTCSYIYRLHLPWTISHRCYTQTAFYDLRVRMSSSISDGNSGLPTPPPFSRYALQYHVCTWIVNILGRENETLS